MSNMAYCRFQNTLQDLQDCAKHILDDDLSEQEEKARKYLIETCRDILDEVDFDRNDDDQKYD